MFVVMLLMIFIGKFVVLSVISFLLLWLNMNGLLFLSCVMLWFVCRCVSIVVMIVFCGVDVWLLCLLMCLISVLVCVWCSMLGFMRLLMSSMLVVLIVCMVLSVSRLVLLGLVLMS